MKWKITLSRLWEDMEEPDSKEIGKTEGSPENWLRGNMPGVLNFGSDYKIGVTISYDITYQNGDSTVISFTKED